MRTDDRLERLRQAYEAAYADREAVLTLAQLWGALGWLRGLLRGIEIPEEGEAPDPGHVVLRLARPWGWVPGARGLVQRMVRERLAHRVPVGTELDVR